MTVTIPESHLDLLTEPNAATVATIMDDGQPQTSVVWCNVDGGDVLFNTAMGRQKAENLRERSKVSLLVIDPDNMYRYIEVRGEVSLTQEGARAHIDQLAQMYQGVDSYYGGVAQAEQADKETRVICRITATKVNAR